MQSRFRREFAVVLLGAAAILAASHPAVGAASEPAGALALRGKNLLANPGLENSAGWELIGKAAWDSTVARSGRRSLRCTGESLEGSCGARQVIQFDPPLRHPIRVAGWSRAEKAEVAQDYNIYLDVHHADGTPLWGQIARFAPGSHDWQQAELIFDPARPVKTIEVFVFFRKCRGTVWFDDLEVGLAPFEFRKIRTAANAYGRTSLAVTAATSLPASWQAWLEGPSGVVARAGHDAMPISLDWLGGDSALAGDYVLHLEATDKLLGQSIRMQRPVKLTGEGVRRGYAVWTESSMRRVLPSAPPPDLAAAMRNHPGAEIRLAGDEYESFQVLIRNGADQPIRDVTVELGDLTASSGPAKIGAANIQWHQVGYFRLEKLRPHPADPEAVAGWWPDALLPVPRFDVAPRFAQAVWVTVHAPPGTPAGMYRGKIVFRPRQQPPVEVQVTAEVYGFSLPQRGHLKTAFALMDGFLERLYGKPQSADVRRKFGDFVLAHRLNPDDISRTEPPVVDDLVHYKDRGLNAFNVLNMVQPRGNSTWVCFSPLTAYTPEFKRQLIARLDPAVEELRRQGLEDRAYIYTFDERGEEYYPVMREYFGMVKQRYPKVHTLTTAQVPLVPEKMRELGVDWACPLTPGYDFQAAEKCRAAGLGVWAYVCMGPGYPYANWLADHPLIEARVIGWQAYEQKMDGLLYWGLNIWDRANNERKIDPRRGPLLDFSFTTGGECDWLHGDGVLLYPGLEGPIGSIRLANLRDAMEDYEYLWLLGQKLGDVDAARRACLPVTESLIQFTRDPSTVYSQRQAVARSLGDASQ